MPVFSTDKVVWVGYEMASTNFVPAAITLLFLYSMLRQTFGGRAPVWLIVAFSLIVFSPVQWENWTWGWQIGIILNVLGVVVAVWSLSRWPGRPKGLLVAIVAAVVASYSFNNGQLTWLIALPLLLRKEFASRIHIAVWVTAAIATCSLYYHGYVKPARQPEWPWRCL